MKDLLLSGLVLGQLFVIEVVLHLDDFLTQQQDSDHVGDDQQAVGGICQVPCNTQSGVGTHIDTPAFST